MSRGDDDHDHDPRNNVGYGKPPKEHQFKKGQPSPNPKGRPKKEEGLASALSKALSDEITVTTSDGRKSKMTAAQAISKQAVALAAKGNVSMIRTMLAHEKNKESTAKNDNEEPEIDPVDQEKNIELVRAISNALLFEASCELYDGSENGIPTPNQFGAPIEKIIKDLKFSRIRNVEDYKAARSECIVQLIDALNEYAFDRILCWDRRIQKSDLK